MKFGQFVATQESLGVEPITDMELAQVGTELAEEASVMASESDSIIETDNAISDAFTAVDHLSEATEVLSKDSSDLSPLTVTAMESLYSSIMTGLGMDEDRVTMESNGDNRAAWIATMEDKKEGIFAKIVSAVISLLTAAMGFIGQLFKNTKLIRMQLNGLLGAVSKSSDFKGGGKLKAGFSDYDEAIIGIKAADDCLDYMDTYNGVLDGANVLMKKGTDALSSMGGVDKLIKESNEGIEKIPTSGFYNGAKMEIDKSEKLYRISFVKGNGNKDAEGLSKNESIRLLKEAIGTINYLGDIKKTENIIQHTIRSVKIFFSDKWNEYRSKSSDTETADKAKKQLAANAIMSTVRALVRNFTTVVPVAVIETVRAVAAYVKASFKIKESSISSKVDQAERHAEARRAEAWAEIDKLGKNIKNELESARSQNNS